jgi:hypothetical protein
MKTTKSSIFLFSAATLFVACTGCTEQQHPNRAHFHIPTSDRKMMLTVQLNDTLTATGFFFDTGCRFPSLDSTFFFTHNLAPDASPVSSMISTYKSLAPTRVILIYSDSVTTSVKVGEATVEYNGLTVVNLKNQLHNDAMEGIIPLPFRDTTQVWEVNFEHSYLEVHAAADFQMPEGCMLFPLIRDEKVELFGIQIPLRIVCEGDTLSSSRTYFIDTGDPSDITIASPAEEMDFFNRYPDAATWIGIGGWYSRRYTVKATAWDSFPMDSLRIYTFSRGGHLKYMVGFNFLKRFNVFFDLKNQQIGLLPIKFERVVNPGWRVFHYSSPPRPDGTYRITVMGNYKKNYFKTAGLQVGDEIVMVNDSLYKDVMSRYNLKEQLWSSDTLRFDILRNGQPLRIAVPVDKNEERGD